MDKLNDLAFVRKLIAGDVASFSTLCDGLKRKLPEFLVRELGLSYPDSEEVASAVLFKVHDSIKTFQLRPDAKLTTWIFQIAKHAGIDLKRKLISQSHDLSEDSNHNGPRLSPAGKKRQGLKRPVHYEAEMLGEDDSTISRRVLPYKNAFEKLNERDKDILRMKNVLSYAEISEREGAGDGALRTRHSRALSQLRGLMKNGGDSDV